VSLLWRLTSSQIGERYKFKSIRSRDESEWTKKEEIQPQHVLSSRSLVPLIEMLCCFFILYFYFTILFVLP